MLALLFSLAARAEERIDLPTRPNVTEPVYASFAAHPPASLILFPGADGIYAKSARNFLVRIAPELEHQGFALIVDTPSDHPGGMNVAVPR